MHEINAKPGHGHHPKGPKPPHGPKEREAAIALTVAILNASNASGNIEQVERIALELYGRVLGLLTKPSPSPQ